MPKKDGKWSDITEAEATEKQRGQPVPGFDVSFEWFGGPWKDLFSEQVKLVQRDIARVRAEDKLVVYLSCPISSRGGGWEGTNVDIAKFTERRWLDRWGDAFWILNPAQYQMESKAGTGLLEGHAEALGINLKQLLQLTGPPGGGDYMRMWTVVLVADNPFFERDNAPELANTGRAFDAYYFLGPRDVHEFFRSGQESLTAGIQAYFARKLATDPDFRAHFSLPGIQWGPRDPKMPMDPEQEELRDQWERKRIEFLRYYSLRASANFSLGSHDEWVLFRCLNRRRRAARKVGEQIAGYFDGVQLDPSSSESLVSSGYATDIGAACQ